MCSGESISYCLYLLKNCIDSRIQKPIMQRPIGLDTQAVADQPNSSTDSQNRSLIQNDPLRGVDYHSTALDDSQQPKPDTELKTDPNEDPRSDFLAFAIVIHEKYGYLFLKCERKLKKRSALSIAWRTFR